MDDNDPKGNPPADFNKLDLSQLQGFSFGTQWTQEKPGAAEPRRDRGEPGERPRRDSGGPDRRDRRSFRRPAEAPGEGGAGGGAAPERRGGGDRYPRREGSGEYRGGPRREGGYGGDRGARYGHGGGRPIDRGPYESPYYSVTFYPEDSSFNTLVQTIRKSCRTVELFEIARTVVAKTDRFVVVMTHKPAGAAEAARGRDAGATPAEESPRPRPVFYISVPDGLPFESDEAAVAHVLSRHLDKFFDTAAVEIDPPKGNFLVINKCGLTGELLGPPNYHRYNQIVQQHYAARIASRMSIEAYRSRIETIRDPEVVNQWLAKMKKATRYTWRTPAARQSEPAAAPAAAPAPAPGEGAEGAPSEAAAATDAAPAQPEVAAPVVPAFDTLEDARLHLLTHAREKVVRTSETARFHGKIAETLPPGEIRRAVEGALERQRRFPLDTANALRGRLRREHFTIFKKGSKGISYVCAVKRKFRVPGQTFAESIGTLIAFIEANPMVRASELAGKLLGLNQPAPVKAEAPAAAGAEAGGPPPAENAATEAAAPARTEPELTIDDRARLARMQNDLMWLVREGYVTEFIDGRLFAPPPMVEARKKEIESEEHDPENFPDVPATPPAADGKPEPAAGGSASESESADVAGAPQPEANVPADAGPEASSEPTAEPPANSDPAAGNQPSAAPIPEPEVAATVPEPTPVEAATPHAESPESLPSSPESEDAGPKPANPPSA